MTEPREVDDPILKPRRTLDGSVARIATHGVLGLVAGGLIFALESLDRLRTLQGNLYGADEALRLVVLTAATILLALPLALVAGLTWEGAGIVFRVLRARFDRLSPRWRDAVALVAASAIVAGVLRVLSGLFPWALQSPVTRLINRIDLRLMPLGPVAEYPKLTFTLGLAVAVLLLVGLHLWLFSARRARSRYLAIPVAALALIVVATGYLADSRIEYTRYELMFHIPLEVIYGLVALVGCVAAARALGDPATVALSRPVLGASVVLLALGLTSVVYGAVAMDANQNVKALFWGRSIVARRAFQVARLVTDMDGDGFSARFGGGDLDDSDPTVNPLAGERVGNGVDDNCIGGDLTSSDYPTGGLYVSVGERGETEVVPAQPSERPQDILLITIDCLRADHLGSYGYPRATSPNLDRLAGESLLFEHPFAQGTNTGHSFTSMFRSSYADDLFDNRIPSFVQIAGENGYRCQLINAIRMDAWLNANRWGKYREIMNDFEAIHSEGERFWDARRLTDEAISLIDRHDNSNPTFTWIHYFDVHRPRRKHPQHDFGRGQRAIYDANIAYVDEHVGRLIDHLRTTGALDRTLVILTADHGEAFREHGAQDHSNKPYNNNALVPLIIRAPGVTPARIADPVALIDVAPTALLFAGIAVPDCYRGVDLLSAARTGSFPDRVIVSETPRNLIQSSFYSWALVDWPHKIIWDVRSNTIEIFDLVEDPGEQRNLVDRDPSLASRMVQRLGDWLDRETARTGAVGPGDSALDDS